MANIWRTLIFLLFISKNISGLNSAWSWECKQGYCQKIPIPEDSNNALSLPVCRVLCSEAGALWPKPTGKIKISTTLVQIDINHITDVYGAHSNDASFNISKRMIQGFNNRLTLKKTLKVNDGKAVEIKYNLTNPDISQLTLDTKEEYTLEISKLTNDIIPVTITADNIFGARHGLETLYQLIVYDDLRDYYVLPNEVMISDQPAYSYRGISLDTSRNFITVHAICKTIDGMASSKLNTLHWHITDSHSFPFTATSLTFLSEYGAYSPSMVYSPDDVSEIVQYGLEHGVRVIPEFDAPAHVGEGWQTTEFVVCFNSKPWQKYCVEPPCGQFDPTKEKLYDTLEALYGDMVTQFQPPLFHMGGDEVHFGCWNSTPAIVNWMKDEKGWDNTEAGFVQLWTLFQNESEARLYKKAGHEIPIILWSSTLTHENYLHYLSKDKYIIQVWTLQNDSQITTLLENDYRIILSNYDALYLDCGFAGWVDGGHNWCAPYIGWQKVYENKPAKIAGNKKHLVLGAEAALWSEQADSSTIDHRIWPRAAALGEVLWSEPDTSWRQAESRMLVQRERLTNLGINADNLEPEWCVQNEENCPIGGVFNQKAFATKMEASLLVIVGYSINIFYHFYT